MVCSVDDVLGGRIVPVNLCLQLLVRVWMGHETAEKACERAGDSVGTSDHRCNAVVDKLLKRWRLNFWITLGVLFHISVELWEIAHAHRRYH